MLVMLHQLNIGKGLIFNTIESTNNSFIIIISSFGLELIDEKIKSIRNKKPA